MKMDVTRQGVTPAIRPVPTDNTLAILPMTAGRVGRDLEESDNTTAHQIANTEDAFQKFRPSVSVKETIGDATFDVNLQFESLRDFDPDRVLTRKAGQKNDLADLHGRIQLLNQIRKRFAQQKVKQAWGSEQQREQLIAAVRQFQQQINDIASGK